MFGNKKIMDYTIKEKIEQSGPPGSINRMNFISNLSPTEYPEESIEAAKRVVYKRYQRIYYIERGFTLAEANILIQREQT